MTQSWRKILWAIAAVVAVFGVFQLFHQPHAKYLYLYTTPTVGTQVERANCVTPWNRWTGHYTPLGANATNIDIERAAVACNTATTGQEHLAFTLLVVSLLLIGASFIRRGDAHAQEPPELPT